MPDLDIVRSANFTTVRKCRTSQPSRLHMFQEHHARDKLITSKKRFFNSTWKVEPAHALSGTSTARRIFVGSDSLSSDDIIDSCVVTSNSKKFGE